MMFIEDPPEFLRCSCDIGNDNVVTFVSGSKSEASVFLSVSSDTFLCEIDVIAQVFICSVKASTSLALILTQVLSTYLNQWLGAVIVE